MTRIAPRLVRAAGLVIAGALACSNAPSSSSEPRHGNAGTGGSAPASSAVGGTGGSDSTSGRGGTRTDSAGSPPSSAGTSASGTGGASAGGGSAGASGRTSGGRAGGGGRGGAAGNAATAGAGGSNGGAAGSSGGAAGASNGGGSGGARPVVTAAQGTTLVKVNFAARHQTFEGWGTSLCWWANHVGGWDAAGRDAVVAAVVDPVNGLGYNVFRYNIGGGDDPTHHHLDQYKDMPGFEPAAGTWNWDADQNQRAVLQSILAHESGVILEAFSNSPPYWMTKSGCASGNTDGSNNLKDDSYDAFADYLTEVVKHYHDAFGITFRTLEALNEPNANWWKANGGQEGCHFSPSNQQTIIKALGAKLTAKGLSGTTVSASDENSIDDGYDNMRAFDAPTLAAMSQMNVHTYSGSRRTDLRALATSKAKRLWQSESGPLNQTLADDTEAALFMAGRIITDLRDLQAEAWIDWQAGDPNTNWASFSLNDAKQTLSPLKRFYMHAGFSRYIRPGAVFVDIDNTDMVAAVSADGHSLAIVVRNGDTSASKGFTFDLTTLPSLGAAVAVHRTSRSEDLAAQPDIDVQSYRFIATVPAFSVTTFVVNLP